MRKKISRDQTYTPFANNRVLGSSIWKLKPYYLGPWVLRVRVHCVV